MKYQLVTKPLSQVTSEYLVLPIFENFKNPFNGIVTDFLSDNPKFGKLFDSQLLYSKSKKLLLLGAGDKKNFDYQKMQNWSGTAAKILAKKTKNASFFLPQSDTLSAEEVIESTVIGIEIALYDPTLEFKSQKEPNKFVSVELVVDKAERGYQTGIKNGQILSDSINLTRKLGDLPANIMTPTYFLTVAKKLAKENKLKLTFLDEKQARKKGMGAFVGVAQGSNEPSYIIALEYKGDIKSKEKWGLIGKGITFDSGGISLKPASVMPEMKYDMAGAATVLTTIVALAKLGVKSNLAAVMAVTENLPGGKAQRPGDIVKTYSGKTVEILNTDAEGRLVLADAISFAQKDLKVTKIIDLATLTSAMIVALGNFYTGIFGNDPKFTQDLIVTGAKVGEKFWQLPLSDEYDEMIKSDFADLTNVGHGGSHPSAAGSITAAKFIENVIEKGITWLHLDIAGTAWDTKQKPYRQVGATGVGVKSLVKLIEG